MKFNFDKCINDILNESLFDDEDIDLINVINEDILDKVKNIVNGDRLDSYGLPKESFQRIADYWNVYMNHTIGDGDILPKDVAIMMALFKLAREENKHKEDNIVDMLAYILLYDKVRE